jgi:hypothetical protein
MAGEEEKKGFTIRDRRSTVQSETETEGKRAEQGREVRPPRETEKPEADILPEIDFPSFIFSLSTSALLHLGEIADPTTQEKEKNLPLAKQTIDILGMLREKTRGNLTPDEEKILDSILADLRWRYIRETKG